VYRDELLGTRVLHDAGVSFKFDGEYILEDGADMLQTFPPDQHGELSVLDNKLNAVAKKRWRETRRNKDMSYDALLLLHCIDNVDQESVTTWWNQNFMLKKSKLTLEAVKAHLATGKRNHGLRQSRKERYLASYEQWKEDKYAEGL
jgi:hypothetical protein